LRESNSIFSSSDPKGKDQKHAQKAKKNPPSPKGFRIQKNKKSKSKTNVPACASRAGTLMDRTTDRPLLGGLAGRRRGRT
jgi:hypothetical protein